MKQDRLEFCDLLRSELSEKKWAFTAGPWMVSSGVRSSVKYSDGLFSLWSTRIGDGQLELEHSHMY